MDALLRYHGPVYSFSKDRIGYRAYNLAYYQITDNSLRCPVDHEAWICEWERRHPPGAELIDREHLIVKHNITDPNEFALHVRKWHDDGKRAEMGAENMTFSKILYKFLSAS